MIAGPDQRLLRIEGAPLRLEQRDDFDEPRAILLEGELLGQHRLLRGLGKGPFLTGEIALGAERGLHFAQRLQQCLGIQRQRLATVCVGELGLGPKTPAFEDRHRDTGRHSPQHGIGVEEIGEIARAGSAGAGQHQPRQAILGGGAASLIGSGQAALGGDEIGSPRQQLRGQPCRHRAVDHRQVGARLEHARRITAEQHFEPPARGIQIGLLRLAPAHRGSDVGPRQADVERTVQPAPEAVLDDV